MDFSIEKFGFVSRGDLQPRVGGISTAMAAPSLNTFLTCSMDFLYFQYHWWALM
jgi:hypothetical protein